MFCTIFYCITQFCGFLCQLSLAWKLAKLKNLLKHCFKSECTLTTSVCFQRKNLVKSPRGNMAFHLPFCYKVAQRVEVGVKYWSKYYRIRYPFQILRPGRWNWGKYFLWNSNLNEGKTSLLFFGVSDINIKLP